MIPQRLHELVWLDSSGEKSSAFNVIRVLIICAYQVYLMPVTFVSKLKGIVHRTGN